MKSALTKFLGEDAKGIETLPILLYAAREKILKSLVIDGGKNNTLLTTERNIEGLDFEEKLQIINYVYEGYLDDKDKRWMNLAEKDFNAKHYMEASFLKGGIVFGFLVYAAASFLGIKPAMPVLLEVLGGVCSSILSGVGGVIAAHTFLDTDYERTNEELACRLPHIEMKAQKKLREVVMTGISERQGDIGLEQLRLMDKLNRMPEGAERTKAWANLTTRQTAIYFFGDLKDNPEGIPRNRAGSDEDFKWLSLLREGLSPLKEDGRS